VRHVPRWDIGATDTASDSGCGKQKSRPGLRAAGAACCPETAG
jgi:hypothetical protein